MLLLRAAFRVAGIGMIGMKLNRWSVLLGMGTLATAVAAGPRVVADSACPHYAVDIEAFATWIHPALFKDVDPVKTLDEINKRFLAVPYEGAGWIGLK